MNWLGQPVSPDLCPGDVLTDVPFDFHVHDPATGREDDLIVIEEDGGLFRAVEQPSPEDKRQLQVIERRRIFAVIHPLMPECEIDDLIEPHDKSRKAKAPSEETVIPFFQCLLRGDIPDALWNEKVKHPDRHRAIFYLGCVPGMIGGDGKPLALMANFRQEQQVQGYRAATLTRIASLTEDGLKVFRGAYWDYLRVKPT